MVDSGQVVMDHAAAERVAKVYEDKADALMDEVDNAQQLTANGAYGRCFIGAAMDKKFADKVNHPESGVVAVLLKMEKTMRDMAQAHRDSAREVRNADEEGQHAMRKI